MRWSKHSDRADLTHLSASALSKAVNRTCTARSDANLPGHACLSSPLWARTTAHRPVPRLGRGSHSDLTICLFAELPAVLMRNPNRVLSFLRKAGVVDDPGFDRAMALDLGQHHLAHLRQDRVVRPCPLPNKMQQRLMLRRRPLRRRDRRHWLHALAPARCHRPSAVVLQGARPIRVTNHFHKTLDILHKS